MHLNNVLVTGASGFLGGHICSGLKSCSNVVLTSTARRLDVLRGNNIIQIPSMVECTDWSQALLNQQVVIHAAGLAHDIQRNEAEKVLEYNRLNVHGTLNLARQAASHGVTRFIFISSINVNGLLTRPKSYFRATDIPSPKDLTGSTKFKAELGLMELASKTGMEVVIIRAPLVYGQGVKGNFAKLVKLISTGVPLPFGAINNQRSLVAVDNLVDLIVTCIDHPAAANEVFLAGDGQDLSTTKLLRGVARAMGKPSRLIPVPTTLLMFTATLFGKRIVAQRMLGSLQIDISKARDLLGWKPPITVEEGLRRCFDYQDK